MPSILKKVNRDVLIEYIYDSNNTIVEPYKIYTDSRSGMRSYIGGESSVTNNNPDNQLVYTDLVSGKYQKLNFSDQLFLTVKEYTPSDGTRHDTIKIYLPSNFTFGEHMGIYIRAYTFDFKNKKFFELSNFFFDGTDNQKSYLLEEFGPPKLYQDRTWDKFIRLDIPSTNALGLQRTDGSPNEDSINYNLSGGIGISITSPIFIDFQFISKISQIGGLKTYITSQKFITQFPQNSGTEPLVISIEESPDGDYFEIYPKYEGSFDNFVEFISTSREINKFYYVEYIITLFEENVKGRPITIISKGEDLNNKLEWRPLIKYSSTKAIIDVEMRLINEVDSSIQVRKASYGMKPDQLSKYLINLKKIDVSGVFKPKIYNKKNISPVGIDQLGKRNQPENRIKVPVPTLFPLNKISAFSESSLNTISSNKLLNYHYSGKMKIGIKPFDNIIRFHIASKSDTSLDFLDLTNCQDLKIIFKNSNNIFEFGQYLDERSAPKIGVCQFKIPESKFLDIKNLKKSEGSAFYITTTNQGVTTTIYSGLFDTIDGSFTRSESFTGSRLGTDSNSQVQSDIIDDPDSNRGVALVTRRLVSNNKNPNNNKGIKNIRSKVVQKNKNSK